jgi:CheY-like chemotaxis protein
MKTALIVEDNAVNRELLRELLEMRGYDVAEACDGEEALKKLTEIQPEVLLMDLNMPVLDGYETVRRIRQTPNLIALPVLAVTAYAMRGDREKILNSGFDGYLSKPIQSAELDRALKNIYMAIKAKHDRTTEARIS